MLLGLAVGDALGVPVEFKSRDILKKNPIKEMIGFGSHKVPAGTWSDDSSLSFCLAEALLDDFNVEELGKLFVRWYEDGYWTANGDVFDIGMTTHVAIIKMTTGIKAEMAGEINETSNGNGSLMRIAPLVFHVYSKSIHARYTIIKQVSSITHAHIRSVVSCFYYVEFCRQLLFGKSKSEAYLKMQEAIPSFLVNQGVPQNEIDQFDRLLKNDIAILKESEIKSSGYVVHTLEAAIWIFMTSDNFEECVLKAVNLGDDTDTTAAVTGALAGMYYGEKQIPLSWLNILSRRGDIESLGKSLNNVWMINKAAS